MSLLAVAGANSASGGYEISNSIKIERDNSERLERASSNGNRRTFTHSCWFKMSDLNDRAYVLQHFGVNNQATRFVIDPGNAYRLSIDLCDTSSTLYRTITDRSFRDTSAWYHVVIAVDTTQSTDSNRLKIYVNGVQETRFSQTQYPTQNLDTLANVAGYGNEAIAAYPWASIYGAHMGYFAEHILVDGQQLDATSFGEFDDDSGIWKPINPSAISFGTNGHYLKFNNASSLGADSAGSNNYTLYNLTSADQATDTPTNNFATWNSLQNWASGYGSGANYIEGGTSVWGSNNYTAAEANMGFQNGKWYWEGEFNRTAGGMFGIGVPREWVYTAYFYVGRNDKGVGTVGGNWYYNGSVASTNYTDDWSDGDIGMMAVDMDNHKIYFGVNGTWADSSNPATGTGGYDFSSATELTSTHVVPCTRIESANSTSRQMKVNFGGYCSFTISSGNSDANGYGNFEYSVPSGYYALCTQNLALYG